MPPSLIFHGSSWCQVPHVTGGKHEPSLAVAAFHKCCRCCGKPRAWAPGGLATGCCPGLAACPALCWWGSPAPQETATPFLPWLPLEYCLHQASPLMSEMVLHCPFSVCPQGGVLQSPVFTSPPPPLGSTTGDVQDLHRFPNMFLVQLKGNHKILWKG